MSSGHVCRNYYYYNSNNKDNSKNNINNNNNYYYWCYYYNFCYYYYYYYYYNKELTHSKTILEYIGEIEPKPVALDFKNLFQYSRRSK